MIEFVMDRKSKLAPSVQLVQQVRQALRTGLLLPGDRLPTVREVAGSLAINPNTVLKAYRELEIEGLVEGRPGVGTFARESLKGPTLASHTGLKTELVEWLSRAAKAGLETEDVIALVETTLRDTFKKKGRK